MHHAIAQEILSFTSRSVVVDGLSLPCFSCRQSDNNKCEITIENSSLLVPCEEIIDYLLPLVTPENYSGELPSAEELHHFLMNQATAKSKNVHQILHAMELLLQIKDGRELIRKNAKQVFALFPDEIIDLITKDKGTPSDWLVFWKLPDIDDAANFWKLRAVIAAKHPELRIEDLFKELSSVDYRRDLQILKVFGSSLSQIRSDWAARFNEISLRLELCIKSGGSGEVTPETSTENLEKCSTQELETLPQPDSDYLQNIVLQHKLRIISDLQSSIAADEIISTLRDINYRKHRTPKTHQSVLAALNKALDPHSIEPRANILADNNMEMLITFATYDSDIAFALASLLHSAAIDDLNRDNVTAAANHMRQSYQIYPEPISEREEFAKRFALKGQLRIPIVKKASLISNASKTNILAVLIGTCILILGFPFFIWAIFRKKVFLSTLLSNFREKVSTDKLQETNSSSRVKELQVLLNYFNLPHEASLDELTRRYRVLAKQIHPDSLQGLGPEEFMKLKQNFERAKELLNQD